MGSPFGDPIFMPALSWRHGSARLRRGTRMTGAGGGAGNGKRRWWARAEGRAVRQAAQVAARAQGAAGASEVAEARACGKRARPGPQGTKPVRPVRGLAARGPPPRKSGQRWQVLRAMRDFGPLDAKRGPCRQDSRAMYPESPDCTRKWIHKARILPF